MEKVSVIIPVYNKFDKLFSAIDSALSQDYPELEIIVSDDGSKDFPFRKVEEYILEKKQDHLFNYEIIANKKNMGTVRNMNGAIKASHGDILINLAGDDRFCEKNTVSKIVDYMDQNSLDNLVCRRKTVEDNFIPNDRQVKFLKKFNTANKQKKAIVNGYLLASGSVFSIRKQLIDRLDLYDERYILIEDMPFFYKMTQNNIKINFNYDITSVVYSEDGVSGVKNKKFQTDEKNFLVNIIKSKENDTDIKRVAKYRLIRKYRYNNLKKISKIKFYIDYLDIIMYRMFDFINDRVGEKLDKIKRR